MRFTRDQLRDKALEAVEEAYAQALAGTPPQKAMLRFALAYLANEAQERWPFDTVYRELIKPGIGAGSGAAAFGNRQSLTGAMNGLYLQLGLKRER